MTPNAQRIAIAEACGWKCEHKNLMNYHGEQDYWSNNSERNLHTWELPDYLNDLNAMHEAEKVLTDEQTDGYARKLLVQVANQPTNYVWHASADQRAEAFLRTLGLWKDDEPSYSISEKDYATFQRWVKDAASNPQGQKSNTAKP